MDDKMCSFSAYQALLNLSRHQEDFLSKSADVAVVYLSDNEELGSNNRQGAKGNFLDSVLERITEIFVNEREDSELESIKYPPPVIERVIAVKVTSTKRYAVS
jgi:aminopeptidase I